mmetsp:Transcript_25421/g.83610  ORF Transcript_25421/g.83610 Transcript_25421/m.83610 type:complete len:256 (+) Transcript_25421:1607-2374(+)
MRSFEIWRRRRRSPSSHACTASASPSAYAQASAPRSSCLRWSARTIAAMTPKREAKERFWARRRKVERAWRMSSERTEAGGTSEPGLVSYATRRRAAPSRERMRSLSTRTTASSSPPLVPASAEASVVEDVDAPDVASAAPLDSSWSRSHCRFLSSVSRALRSCSRPLAVRGVRARQTATPLARSYMLQFVRTAPKSSVVSDLMMKTMYGGKLKRNCVESFVRSITSSVKLSRCPPAASVSNHTFRKYSSSTPFH